MVCLVGLVKSVSLDLKPADPSCLALTAQNLGLNSQGPAVMSGLKDKKSCSIQQLKKMIRAWTMSVFPFL